MCRFGNTALITERKRSVIRLAALALCIILIAVSLFSAAYIFVHADHIHDHNGTGGSCATCAHISAAGNLLKSLFTAITGAVSILGGLYAVLSILKLTVSYRGSTTLVSLNIRSNN
ncbi:MAG: hypothetical protein LBT88_03040 [Oscillospiraceae bacterium]|jgi:hypothetical protein|nr:hypothetical protein [Oscillospiraceae bacterium]